MNDMTLRTRPLADPDTGACPVAEILRELGGKHGPRILHCLLAREMHFLELERAVTGISRKVLKAQLTDFIAAGLVVRRPKHDARNRVGYGLTPKGQALGPILFQLYDWSQTYKAQAA